MPFRAEGFALRTPIRPLVIFRRGSSLRAAKQFEVPRKTRLDASVGAGDSHWGIDLFASIDVSDAGLRVRFEYIGRRHRMHYITN